MLFCKFPLNTLSLVGVLHACPLHVYFIFIFFFFSQLRAVAVNGWGQRQTQRNTE